MEKTNNGKNNTAKSRKYQNARRNRNLQILGNFGRGYHQISADERKTLEKVPLINKKSFTESCSATEVT